MRGRTKEPELTRRELLRSASVAAATLGYPLAPRAAVAHEWSNWSDSVQFSPQEIARPASVDDVITAVRKAAEAQYTVRAVGSGHSFVPLCATDGMAMVLSRLRGIESIDAERSEATVLAGSKLYHLGKPFRKAGLAMEALPDIDRQAVAGAIATGTHGTGKDVGNLSTRVVGLRLVTADGDMVECSTRERPDVLRAAQVSLGVLGIITHVRMQLVSAFRLHERTWIAPYEDCVAQLADRIQANRHFEFFWVSERDACLMKALNLTDATEDLEHYEDKEKLVGERIGWSDEIFPSPRNTLFNEIEYSVPAERGPECLAELRQLMLGKYREIDWPLEYRTVAADDIFLSQAYGRPTVSISAHQAAELPHEAFFADVEAIFRNYKGRPHWGKIHSLGAADLEALYPMWSEFQKVRQELDPQGRFLNPHARDLLL